MHAFTTYKKCIISQAHLIVGMRGRERMDGCQESCQVLLFASLGQSGLESLGSTLALFQMGDKVVALWCTQGDGGELVATYLL